MISIIDIGMNHESAPVELRECLAGEEDNETMALRAMKESAFIKEAMFLSTCNRVEALYTTDNPQEAKERILNIFSEMGDVPRKKFLSNLYIHEDDEAVRHIFRVASSLDSMVLGEPQILGQIKDAYSLAAGREKTTGVILNRLMHRAFHVAKRVKTETAISEAAVSISYAAVELANKIFHGLKDRKVLLVGAGEMAELAATYLLRHGTESLVVANRSFENAVRIADSFQGKAVSFEEIEVQLLEADIIITSTASIKHIITYDSVKQSLRKRRNRPLFFIDIAVPRNVDPEVNRLGNVYLYDIDDLKEVVQENSARRKQESIKAERIVDEEVIRFHKWLKTLEVVPTIISLKEKAEAIRISEMEKSLSSMGALTDSQVKAIEALTISLAEKIINHPILVLKSKAGRSSKDSYLDITRKLFNLDQDNGGDY
ncbi:MAG: glutamyl-tRNA reductase [Deltaproteobacteria bacterium]|nr:glutamyl-tRNA reductase [Deltaproteobacteria bacterium]